jgi:serine-type D-Ala-D-Ala carboxypeptidase
MIFQAVHQEMLRGLAQGIFTAAVLLVDCSGSTLFHGTYGTLDVEKQHRPVSASTLFDLASLTKVLSTTPLWMLLAEKDPEILDRPLTTWFPNLTGEKAEITPRSLLAHSSGLKAWQPYYLMLKQPLAADEPAGLILNERLDYPQWSRTVYSDLGFMLLKIIYERETAVSLEESLRDRVLAPLGIDGKMVFKPQTDKYEIAPTRPGELPGLVHDLNARALGGVSGHAGLFGTASGIARIAREYLAGLKGSGLFKTATVKEFFHPVSRPPGSSRALGFDTARQMSPSSGRFFSPASVGHTGFTGVSLWIDPESELVVVLLTNRVYAGESDLRIRDFRPMIHDLVVRSVKESPQQEQ